MKVNNDSLDKLPQMLEIVLKAPRMFFGDEMPSVFNFVEGLRFMYSELDVSDAYYDTFNMVIKERGWRFSAHHPFVEMRERGMSEQEITAEVLTIEIEVWKRLVSS